jgi:hypothetical protein
MPYNLRSRSKNTTPAKDSVDEIPWETMMTREEEREIARILLSLSDAPVSRRVVHHSMVQVQVEEEDDDISSAGGECDSDSDYQPSDDEDSVDDVEEHRHDDDDEEYVPADDEDSVDEDEDEDEDSVDEDEDYEPSEAEDSVDEDGHSVDEDEDDDDYVPEEDTDEMEELVRDACSCLARRKRLPVGFHSLLDQARSGNLPAHFVEWMNTIPPISRMLSH